ncbi:MAG: ATP-binding protein [bacterium]|nr:ATP-binding protein [bacterium]
MSNLLGIVASGSGVQEMTFYSSGAIETDYAKIEHDGRKTIYRIRSVRVVNKRLAESDFVRYIGEGDDYSKYNIYVADAVSIASIDETQEIYEDYWYIALPGSKVVKASAEEIAIAHGIIQREGTQEIGHLKKREDVPVWLDFRQLLTTHMAVIGRSGQGKSNFTRIVLSNISMQYMVFTPTNEYINIRNAKQIDATRFSIPLDMELIKKILRLNNSEISLLKAVTDKIVMPKTIETRELADKVMEFYKPKEVVDYSGRKAYDRSSYLASLCEKLRDVDLKIGAKTNVIPKESYVFNMQKLSSEEQEILIYLYLNQLLNYRRENYIMLPEGEEVPNRIVIFLEEAHNYIPSTKSSFCKDVINSIAREGRKLGLHIVLLSQRPRYLDPTTLSQCGSIVSFNLANPDDVDYIMSNANFYDDIYKKVIPELKIGECIIVSDYLKNSINCKVHLY